MAAFTRLYGAMLRAVGRKPDEQNQATGEDSDLGLAMPLRRAQCYQESALPAALLQAFSDEPLAAGDSRFVGRAQPLERLLAALERWRAGRSSMLVVAGPPGCGVTSLLQQVPGQLAEHEAFSYGSLPRRPRDAKDALMLLGEAAGCTQTYGSIEELVTYLNGLEARVFIIDNGHFLTNRTMDAHQGIRVFGAVMVATQRRHLWILGCQEYAWHRLVYVYQADRYFSDTIELGLFDEAELGQCIDTRMQAAGIRSPDATAGEQQELPAIIDHQLPTLYRLTNGKCDLAFFYHLRSLRVQPEDDQLDTQPIAELDFSALENLVSDDLFTLAELAAHGQLSIAEHCAIFRSSHDESWLLLEHLYHQCLVDKSQTDGDPTYRIMPLFSGPIGSHLSNANVVY